MPIDSSIAMSGRQVQLDNPLEVQAKVATLRHLAGQQEMQQMQLQHAQRAQEQENTLSDLYRGNVNPDGTVNRQGVLSGAAQRGLGGKIPGMQKQFAEADKATADVGHVGAQTKDLEWKVQKGKIEASGNALSSLLANPNTTHDDVIKTMVGLVNQGIVTAEQGQQAIRELPGDPVRLRQYLVQKGMEVMDAGKRMELTAPKRQEVNDGKTTTFVDVNPYTNPQGPAPIKMQTTPGQDQSNATTIRGQNLVNARAADANGIANSAARTQIVEGPDGFMLVDKGTGLARPAATLNGQQVQGKDTGLNDSQSKALLFGSRMREAEKVLTSMATKGTVRPSVMKGVVEGTPLVGGALGALANNNSTPEQQQVEQAQQDWLNAVLRRESGAVIGPSEFASGKKQYFPEVGDSPEKIAQKTRNRKLAMEGILTEVPAKKRNSLSAPADETTATPNAGVPDDIAAILKKHGGK
jgi:hypothetical protein